MKRVDSVSFVFDDCYCMYRMLIHAQQAQHMVQFMLLILFAYLCRLEQILLQHLDSHAGYNIEHPHLSIWFLVVLGICKGLFLEGLFFFSSLEIDWHLRMQLCFPSCQTVRILVSRLNSIAHLAPHHSCSAS